MKEIVLPALLEALEATGVDQLLTVPASGLGPVYQHFDDKGRCLYATREEEAVAIAAGLALGGTRPAVLMAQAGVGNALNAVLSLADAYDIYFPVLVFDRGVNDPNPVQGFCSERTAAILTPLGCRAIDFKRQGAVGLFSGHVAERCRWFLFDF